ncbi:ABC transporter permease [Streptomyces sp. TS71-3]|uniref:ABC transporter permease n=1 Tax=Streptomyces sp. TS71-3 TaxID=2733862 RepID=UPI001B1C2508|nr:ABC transporter permease subunit [Streptomyces sp. TS71-3]GHJ41249.1 peptide ABC transporter permease [Streptomyces sp. TS71-3]
MRRATPPRWGLATGSITMATATVLLAVPVLLAVAGPFLTGMVAAGSGAPYATGHGHLLGTDGLGRDVLGLLMRGGPSALGMACGAVVVAYAVGAPLGLTAAVTRRGGLSESLLRPVEILLPLPSLLVISVVGVRWRGEPAAIALAVAAINVPVVARLVWSAALDPASGPVAEAMRMQGESAPRVLFGHIGREILPVVAADVGTRVPTAVFTVAAANFLGLGLDPASPDWGVTIAASREALLVQPWAVCAPAALLVMFSVGLNLLTDTLLKRSKSPGRQALAASRPGLARTAGGTQ